MFVGHYASAIALSSNQHQRGALSFIAISSVMPDLFMIATDSMKSNIKFHFELGFLICVALVIFLAWIFKLKRQTLLLALAALVLHLPLDYPYRNLDSSNLYLHDWLDFGIEMSFLVGAAILYVIKQQLKEKRKYYFVISIMGLGVIQAIFNFVFF